MKFRHFIPFKVRHNRFALSPKKKCCSSNHRIANSNNKFAILLCDVVSPLLIYLWKFCKMRNQKLNHCVVGDDLLLLHSFN